MDRKTYKKGLNRALGFALTEEVQSQAMAVCFPGETATDKLEENGFLGIVFSSSGVMRRTILLNRILAPREGWVFRGGKGLNFSQKYISFALDEAAKMSPGAGLIVAHSHFGPRIGSGVWPSPSRFDLEAEREQLCLLSRALPPGAPTVAGILAPNGTWRIREYAFPRPASLKQAISKKFQPSSGKYLDCEFIRVISHPTIKLLKKSKQALIDISTVESTLLLWGEQGQRLLRNYRIGLVGAGGVGSIVAEYLARLGVGELVIIDFDILKQENLNRASGATFRDLGKPKVGYLRRFVRSSRPTYPIKVTAIRASAAEAEGLSYLLDCDLVISAADSAFSRQVLDHMSYSHLIPVIDGGTKFIVEPNTGEISGKSQVTEAGPLRPCLECQGVYDREEATLARESTKMQGTQPYITTPSKDPAELPRAPSVIGHNGLVASLIVQRVLHMVLGFPPSLNLTQQRFYVERGELMWSKVSSCNSACTKHKFIALGDSHFVPVGIDPVWKEIRESERELSL